MRKLLYILIFVFVGSSFYAQDTYKEDFDVDAYLDSIDFFNNKESIEEQIETVVDEKANEVYYEDYETQNEYFESSPEHQHFDEFQWEKIKKSIVEGLDESEYYADPNGTVLEDTDNPFKKTRKQNSRYWDQKRKNDHTIKRLPQEERRRRRGKSRSFTGGNFGSGTGMIILIILILGFAILIYYMFFKNPTNTGKKKIKYDIETMSPSEIPKTELELLLEKAIGEGDFREAIRIYFVFLIKGLVEKEFITWEKEKTNFSYLNEMRNNELYNEFDDVIYIYETIWYGEREISKQEFTLLQPKFTNLLTKIDVK